MKQYLKENLVLVVGITLPIVMMIVFTLAAVIPPYFVKSPQYNLIFTTGSYNYRNSGLTFEVVNSQIKAQLICDADCISGRYLNKPELYVFDVRSQQAKKIPVTLPAFTPDSKPFNAVINIPELAKVKIDTNNTAPDGYIFSYRSDNDGLLSFLFFNNNDSQAVISKNGNAISIPSPTDSYGSFQNIKFIGWIKPSG